jgi:hypothetical protein
MKQRKDTVKNEKCGNKVQLIRRTAIKKCAQEGTTMMGINKDIIKTTPKKIGDNNF